MPKQSATIEVIDDSASEGEPKSSEKKSPSNVQTQSGDEAGDNDEEAPEEYEIEAILDAKHGAFPAGRMGYLVKWKGYEAEHNSWVDQEDAGNAQVLIDEFWEKKKKNKKSKPRLSKSRPRKSETKDESPTADEQTTKIKRKKSLGSPRKSKSTQPEDVETDEEEEDKPHVKKAKKTPREKEKDEDRMDVDQETEEIEYRPMPKRIQKASWEGIVQSVDTIEKIDGSLKVFFTLNNGDKVVESSQECARRFPQKMIQFYESNLRWRVSE